VSEIPRNEANPRPVSLPVIFNEANAPVVNDGRITFSAKHGK